MRRCGCDRRLVRWIFLLILLGIACVAVHGCSIPGKHNERIGIPKAADEEEVTKLSCDGVTHAYPACSSPSTKCATTSGKDQQADNPMPRRVILGLLGSEEMQKQNNGICFARMDRDRDYSQEMVKILQGRNDEPFVLALMYLEDIGKGELITDQARSRLVAMAITETTSALQWLANCAVTNHEGMPERLINSIPRMDARYSQRLIDVLQRNKMDGPWHEATSTALNAHPENIEWMVEKYRFLAVDVEESVKAYHRSLAVFENFADLFKTFLVPVIEVRERAMRSKPNDMEWIPVESYIDVIWSVVLPRMREVEN